jgi:hypothetical protein
MTLPQIHASLHQLAWFVDIARFVDDGARERKRNQIANAVIVLNDQNVFSRIGHESPSRRPMVGDGNCDG